jgi:hypothetical protein
MHHMVAGFTYTSLESRNCFGGADPVADLHHRMRPPLTMYVGSVQQEVILLKLFIHPPSMVLYVLVNESNIRAL